MPRAILRFNLPEEQEEFQSAVDGGKWKSLVYSFMNRLRFQIKHSSDVRKCEIVNSVLQEINEDIESNNLSLD